jgi:hypothetical protein
MAKPPDHDEEKDHRADGDVFEELLFAFRLTRRA